MLSMAMRLTSPRLQSVTQEIDAVTGSVLRDVSHHVFTAVDGPQERRDMLLRAARRRVAAKMDDSLLAVAASLSPSEQYLHPPLASHLLLGDILRINDSPPADTSSYRLVITPTCDLVPYGNPARKGQCCVDREDLCTGRFCHEGPDLKRKYGGEKAQGSPEPRDQRSPSVWNHGVA